MGDATEDSDEGDGVAYVLCWPPPLLPSPLPLLLASSWAMKGACGVPNDDDGAGEADDDADDLLRGKVEYSDDIVAGVVDRDAVAYKSADGVDIRLLQLMEEAAAPAAADLILCLPPSLRVSDAKGDKRLAELPDRTGRRRSVVLVVVVVVEEVEEARSGGGV